MRKNYLFVPGFLLLLIIAVAASGQSTTLTGMNKMGNVSDKPNPDKLMTQSKSACVDTPTIALLPSDTTIRIGDSVMLTAIASSPSPLISYTWSPDTANGKDNFSFRNCADSTNCSTPFVHPVKCVSITVTVTDANGCKASAGSNMCIATGITKNPLHNISIAPNPSSGHFDLSFETLTAQETEISICNMNGKVIMENLLQYRQGMYYKDIDLTGFPKGFYILQIRTAGAVETKKIEVQ